MDTKSDRIAELEADNQRLRRLLDQRDAPAELRHRLRGTLALLRNIVRRSVGGRVDVSEYAAHLEDRLDTLMRIQGYLDQDGEVELSTLIADELFTYKAQEGEQLRTAGPDVLLRPRAGQAIGLALHELAVNAVEHGALSLSDGRVEVAWRVAEGGGAQPSFAMDWKETGLSGLREPSHHGFGTEVLTSLLRYQLGAETAVAYEPDGVRFSIRIPFQAHVGRAADGPASSADGSDVTSLSTPLS